MTIQAKILDINNVDLKEYRNKYNKHLKEKFYGQQYSYINQEFKKFFDDNFKTVNLGGLNIFSGTDLISAIYEYADALLSLKTYVLFSAILS